MLWTVPALLALSALGGYFLSRQALRPVDEIAAAARSISVMNLSERLPVPATNDELQRLSETCNAMLGAPRFRGQRNQALHGETHRMNCAPRFPSFEPSRNWRCETPAPTKTASGLFTDIVEESGRTSRLLEEMLLLARADDGTAHLSFEPVDLAEIVRVVGAKARLLAEAMATLLDISLPAAETPACSGRLLHPAPASVDSRGQRREIYNLAGRPFTSCSGTRARLLTIEVRDTGNRYFCVRPASYLQALLSRGTIAQSDRRFRLRAGYRALDRRYSSGGTDCGKQRGRGRDVSDIDSGFVMYGRPDRTKIGC